MPLGILTKLKEGVKEGSRKLSVQMDHVILDGIVFGRGTYQLPTPQNSCQVKCISLKSSEPFDTIKYRMGFSSA